MRKIITTLGLAGAFALAGLAVATTGAATPTTTLGACNPGWYVNDDEVGRKPTPTVAGMLFEGNDLIHHAASGSTSTLTPGTFAATPAPDQPSFFSVEVRNPSGAYGTLRWNASAAMWQITIGPGGAATPGTFSGADPAALLEGKVTKWGAFAPATDVLVSFGVGYTNSPPGTVPTVVTSVTFKGTTYDLKCTPPSSSSSSATPSASSSSSKAPSSSPSQTATTPPTSASATPSSSTAPPVITRPPSSGLPLTGTPVAAVAGVGGFLLLSGVALVAWLWRRNRIEYRAE